MSEFLHRLAESVERLGVGGGGCVVAVSGGADSVGLLVGLVRVLGAERLHVAHLEHGLRGAAGREDAAWVQGLCERLGVKATVGAADVGAAAAESGESVETQGREVRYGFLLRVAQDQGCEAVAVGHTADDQAETIVHRIVRGTGLRGLAGMPAVRRLGEGVRLVRPMLGVRRAQVEAFLRAEGVAWREDASNEWL